ncbi:MAG: DUF427 domain-containing protein [Hyphomicrobiales bacterium]
MMEQPHSVKIEGSPRRVRAMLDGQTIADSTNMKLVHESNHLPVYYFPFEDINQEFLEKSDHTSHCPYKGDASYWTIKTGNATAENAVWSYETPMDNVPELKGLAAFYWDKIDHWFEEDEEIFVHARDPYKRIDTVPSSRHVQVIVNGKLVADTTRAMFLFETGLPTRYYIPKADIRMDLLFESTLQTRCPYKGIASYCAVNVEGKSHENLVWYYPDPIAECPKIKDLLCFFNERVDTIVVDGDEIPKQRTAWSTD